VSARTRVALALLLLGCAAAGAWAIIRAVEASSAPLSDRSVHWELAALCVAAMVLFAMIYAVCWSVLISKLGDPGVRPARAMRLFLLTWPGRYLPASAAYYGGRLIAGPSIGVPRGLIAASFVYETLLTIAAAGAVSVLLLLAQSKSVLSGGAWAAAAIAATGIAAASLHPAVSRACIRAAARRIHRFAALEQRVLAVDVLLRVCAGYAAGAVVAGVAFSVALRSLGEETSLITAIAAYNIAGIAGMLAVFVPGGVGVREGVVVALLSGVVSPPVALAAALLTRLASIIADLIPAALIIAVEAGRRIARRGSRAIEPPPAVREAA
jgi:uncharacterized membrane protein YbhN (UPF0104 family)